MSKATYRFVVYPTVGAVGLILAAVIMGGAK